MLDAGNLALFYSKARSGGQADLYYTHVKYLRRPKEGKKGLVLPTHEKNLLVRHDQRRLDRLFRQKEESETGI
jgi:predicted ribosome quality control (RQC) complex YloA/Tae2 family protein